MATHSTFIVGAMFVSAALASGAALADLPQQMKTASTHAGMAANAPDLKGVQTHMKHVQNCLVGPAGQGFDAAAGNPCNGQGQGAIPEAADAATKMKLETALTKTRATVGASDLASAKQGAAEVSSMLK
jgi:hypothetical protein